jgi:anti-anti-sigma regulatory factor
MRKPEERKTIVFSVFCWVTIIMLLLINLGVWINLGFSVSNHDKLTALVPEEDLLALKRELFKEEEVAGQDLVMLGDIQREQQLLQDLEKQSRKEAPTSGAMDVGDFTSVDDNTLNQLFNTSIVCKLVNKKFAKCLYDADRSDTVASDFIDTIQDNLHVSKTKLKCLCDGAKTMCVSYMAYCTDEEQLYIQTMDTNSGGTESACKDIQIKANCFTYYERKF